MDGRDAVNIYRLLRYRNDARALLKGRLPQRIVRRVVWRQTSRLARIVSKALGVSR